MTWLALFLLGCAVVDLVAHPQRRRVLAEVCGVGAAVAVGVLAGQTELGGVLALVVIAVLVLLWSRAVAGALRGGPAWLPLAVIGGGVGLGLLTSGLADPVTGPFASWWSGLGWPLAEAADPGRGLLVLALLLVQLSTGNVVVRLVLSVTGTVNPVRSRAAGDPADPADPSLELKGGRLLGPMERLLILGLGLAGNLTAASIVVAAKGLLRFPELSSRKEQDQVHRLTEYFLVGSFVSWLLALGSLALLAG